MCMLFAHFKLECVRSQFFSDERGGVLSSQATELTANSDTLNRLKNLLSLNKKIIKRRTLYYFISVYIIFPIILNYYCCIRLLIYLFYFGGWVYRICWSRRRMLCCFSIASEVVGSLSVHNWEIKFVTFVDYYLVYCDSCLWY